MNPLFTFLYNNRSFFIFVMLEGICMWFIIKANSYQRVAFVTSANYVSGKINATMTNILSYFQLKSINTQIAYENALLRKQLADLQKEQVLKNEHYLVKFNISSDSIKAPTFQNVYDVTSAYVINNSVHRAANFITLDKGERDGIAPGMGVVNSLGIIGKIKACSQNYSVAYSVLHPDMSISAMLKKDRTLCTAKWDGKSPQYVYLHYLARHVKVQNGDTVVTSGYNAVFPENVMIGVVDEVVKETAEVFLIVRVKLAADFTKLHYVYIIKHYHQTEIDSLEIKNF
ncbi:MAG: rod shape-determining protein MreC [Cytophagales bacterium]|nr:rod shape-determining protein MreC [Cytophagales bacterium]MDW8384053.1 rod shape-determining protein MreC [Flammeovirgaceae bacterium]